ncbi:hypothetical protein DIPPA_21497 [Diplonema papillatum]|nr:hypothetical protein DIPPA_21497 [Diplonema papillatum]|eukprot:gene7950-12201_t
MSSDPFGSRAWNQQIDKELRAAMSAHKGYSYHMPARNPITHAEYGTGCPLRFAGRRHASRSSSSRCSTWSSESTASSRELEIEKKMDRLEETLHSEQSSRHDLERQLEDLKKLCRNKYHLEPDALHPKVA